MKTYKVAELLTVTQLAKILQLKESWVYGHTKKTGPEAIPRVKIGKYLRFDLEDVLDWIERMFNKEPKP